jgi:hypothetical protein
MNLTMEKSRQIDGSDEAHDVELRDRRILRLTGCHSLVGLAYQGTVRLSSINGSQLEIWNPKNTGNRLGAHAVDFSISPSTDMAMQYPDIRSNSSQTVIWSDCHVEANGAKSFSQVFIEPSDAQPFVLRDLECIELIVPDDGRAAAVELLGAWSVESVRREDDTN